MSVVVNKYGVRYLEDPYNEHRKDTFTGSFSYGQIWVPTVYNPDRISELPYFRVHNSITHDDTYFEFLDTKYLPENKVVMTDKDISSMMDFIGDEYHGIMPWFLMVEAWDANQYCGLSNIYSSHCNPKAVPDYTWVNHMDKKYLKENHVDDWMKILTKDLTQLDDPFIKMRKEIYGDNFEAVWNNFYTLEQINRISGEK